MHNLIKGNVDRCNFIATVFCMRNNVVCEMTSNRSNFCPFKSMKQMQNSIVIIIVFCNLHITEIYFTKPSYTLFIRNDLIR